MEIKNIDLVKYVEDELDLARTCFRLTGEAIDSFTSDHASDYTIDNYKDQCKERFLIPMQAELDNLYTAQKYYGCRGKLQRQEKSDER